MQINYYDEMRLCIPFYYRENSVKKAQYIRY